MKTTLEVKGLKCGACVAKVEGALADVPGVQSATVDLASGRAEVEGDVTEAALVAAAAVGGEFTATVASPDAPPTPAAPPPTDEVGESLYPLFLIVGFLAGVCVLTTWRDGSLDVMTLMRRFMAGFFLVFSFFKLLDLQGFVTAYRGYDALAARLPAWGFAYPFVELTLGVLFLMGWIPVATNVITLILMLFGTYGVARALLSRKKIRCACLGAALNLPMTKVTLVENMTMATMAAVMLLR